MMVSLRLYILNLPIDLRFYPNPFKLASLNVIERYTEYNDKVLFYPLDPAAYLISDRSPGSLYYFFLPWQSILPDAEDRVIADIEKNKVKMVVIEPKAIIWDRYEVSTYSGKIYKYVVSNFQPLEVTDSSKAKVFLRKK